MLFVFDQLDPDDNAVTEDEARRAAEAFNAIPRRQCVSHDVNGVRCKTILSVYSTDSIVCGACRQSEILSEIESDEAEDQRLRRIARDQAKLRRLSAALRRSNATTQLNVDTNVRAYERIMKTAMTLPQPFTIKQITAVQKIHPRTVAGMLEQGVKLGRVRKILTGTRTPHWELL